MHVKAATNSCVEEVNKILVDEWRNAHERHGWLIVDATLLCLITCISLAAELGAKTLPDFYANVEAVDE